MTNARILGLGTYPIEKPFHGGQRRVAAFKQFYERKNIMYTYVSIYDGTYYGVHDVGPYDRPFDVSKTEFSLTGVIGDVLSGQLGASDPAMLRHLYGVAEQIAPDVLQVEHPYMWPVAKQLRQISGGRKPLLIYSSHNVEAPLKRAILASCGFSSEKQNDICSEIEKMEAEIAREADLIVCVSEADREYYRRELRSPSPVIVVRNGAHRPVTGPTHRAPAALSSFRGQPYLMTVGSSHRPNIEGLCYYVINGGVFCVPPTPSLAICGGLVAQIFNHPEYQRYRAANAKRVKFFADVSDLELSAIKQDCHGVVLPIRHGGGTNLKTAEALALGKWIVATSTALRGFEEFLSADGVVIADNPADFRHAIRQVLQRPPFELSETSRAARDALYWDRCFDDSELSKFFDDACGLAPRPNSQKRFDALDGNSPAAGRGGMSPAKASRLTIGSVER